MWRKESRKRIKNQFRCERVNRNWPLHAQRVIDVFREVQDRGRNHGVRLFVIDSDEGFRHSHDELGLPLGKFLLGTTYVGLQFAPQSTGTGVLERTEEGTTRTITVERGAKLIVCHSPDQGLVEVHFESPVIDGENEEQEPLLFTHTYNTDDITRDWVMRLVPSFFTFNRVESLLDHPSVLDRMRVRWWKFTDVRNQRGYLDKLQHVLTPWELLVIGATAAPVLWLLSWLWKVLNPFNL
ncbi:hypothetical protein [Pseudomonas anguilliseptica]|uniref:hypothetical protein n=1 Tax=Pseudomonas anguilliseptica TaxID=53406 RepID=UPI0011148729|nr:hypothetical protein [Pseudomonas anguilliseptica]